MQRVTITFETDDTLFSDSLISASIENEGITIRHASGTDTISDFRVAVTGVPTLEDYRG